VRCVGALTVLAKCSVMVKIFLIDLEGSKGELPCANVKHSVITELYIKLIILMLRG